MVISHKFKPFKPLDKRGFSMIELLVAIVIIPFLVTGISAAYNSVRKSYALARQYNEMYAVLSACPELDRALEYTSLSTSSSCYPNNSFSAENGGTATITYTPTIALSDTTSLPGSDPLQAIPDSKVVDISVNFLAPNASKPPLRLRMLITRNGIGQL